MCNVKEKEKCGGAIPRSGGGPGLARGDPSVTNTNRSHRVSDSYGTYLIYGKT